MEPLMEKLLNDFQHDFPLSPTPFALIARRLNTSTATVLARLRELQRQGTVSRVGPVFRPNTIGASTLAADGIGPEHRSDAAHRALALQLPQPRQHH